MRLTPCLIKFFLWRRDFLQLVLNEKKSITAISTIKITCILLASKESVPSAAVWSSS